ncbi:MAG: hypothetical protein NZM38_09925 [Cytophagales bacterium]|nr:hypothetical protein [Cytophagales bacterium]MDW8385073.1 hypothetical protein [Flammeovirgaceae bacterium]
MKQILICALSIGLIIGLTRCIPGEHNTAPNKGVNLDSERIYGIKGGEPLQLKNKYPDDDGTVAERVEKIRNKMFPK